MAKSRSFCFTINNYTSEDESGLLTLGHRYIIYGREVGESGTPHLQGYIVFKNPRHFGSLKSLMPRAHIEVAKGDADSNFKYCSKEGNFVEDGERPAGTKERTCKAGQANKKRCSDFIEAAGRGDFEACRQQPDLWTRYDKFAEREYKRKRSEPSSNPHLVRNFWVYGPTGTGKSYSARLVGAKLGWRTYIKEPQDKWWDGYDGQELVVIDDFDKYQVKQGGDMKRWLDIYPFQAQTKGGMQLIRPKCIIVTSNYEPDEIWTDEQTLAPIHRRVRTMALTPGTFAIQPEDFATDLAAIIKQDHGL